MAYSPIILPWSIDTAIVHSYIFLLAIRFKSQLSNVTLMKFIIAIILFIMIYVINRFPNISITSYGRYNAISIPLYMLLGFLESYIIICISKWLTPFTLFKPIVYCGRNSLRLMCIHMFVLCVVTFYFEKLSNNYTSIVIITFAIVFLLNYILKSLFDKLSNKYLIFKYI